MILPWNAFAISRLFVSDIFESLRQKIRRIKPKIYEIIIHHDQHREDRQVHLQHPYHLLDNLHRQCLLIRLHPKYTINDCSTGCSYVSRIQNWSQVLTISSPSSSAALAASASSAALASASASIFFKSSFASASAVSRSSVIRKLEKTVPDLTLILIFIFWFV